MSARAMAMSPFSVADRLFRFVLGPPGPDRLPTRVEKAIRDQERGSEILIGWAQLGAIAFFATFYAIAPKTFPPDAPFEPVPVTLAAYAVFTAIRLFLAYRRELPAWFLAASVVVDVAVLMMTIWSFHLQYNQPPGLYLKAPTLLYIFIIIALRSLRFDPRWLILVGATACAGWLVLVLYAVHAMGMKMLITHSYVEYMTSLKILVGAEVDKMISLGAVTGVLTLGLIRARRLLVRSIAEQTAAAELSRFFSRDIAETIVSADEAIRPGDGMLREAAAMFVDLRGFTTLASTLDPKSLVRLLGEYQSRVVRIVQAHRGSITTYLGDGIMITFGATRPSETYAADALAAADEMLDVLARWRDERSSGEMPAPGIGLGICAGTVLYGAVGDETRLEYAVIGDPVNRAAKIQNQTKAEQVRGLTIRATYELACRQGYRPKREPEHRPGATVQGVGETLDLVVLG
jgi:adenylate cyclase